MDLSRTFLVINFGTPEDAQKAFEALQNLNIYQKSIPAKNFDNQDGCQVRIQKTGDTCYDNLVANFLRRQEGAFPEGA